MIYSLKWILLTIVKYFSYENLTNYFKFILSDKLYIFCIRLIYIRNILKRTIQIIFLYPVSFSSLSVIIRFLYKLNVYDKTPKVEYFPTLYTNFYLHFSIHSRNSHECMFTTTRQINIRLGVKKNVVIPFYLILPVSMAYVENF